MVTVFACIVGLLAGPGYTPRKPEAYTWVRRLQSGRFTGGGGGVLGIAPVACDTSNAIKNAAAFSELGSVDHTLQPYISAHSLLRLLHQSCSDSKTNQPTTTAGVGAWVPAQCSWGGRKQAPPANPHTVNCSFENIQSSRPGQPIVQLVPHCISSSSGPSGLSIWGKCQRKGLPGSGQPRSTSTKSSYMACPALVLAGERRWTSFQEERNCLTALEGLRAPAS
jgi:hypothetical protein